MASEWAEMYTSALAHGEGFSRTQKEMIANALDATRYRFLREGRREGLEEKQGNPIGWRYKVLVNKHSTGDPLPGEIFMLDIYRTKVWGIPGAWRYSDGPAKPDVDWMCVAEPLFASQEPTA